MIPIYYLQLYLIIVDAALVLWPKSLLVKGTIILIFHSNENDVSMYNPKLLSYNMVIW